MHARMTAQLFDYVTDPRLPKGDESAQFEALLKSRPEVETGLADGVSSEENEKSEAASVVDAAVFAQIHIPRTLDQIPHKQAERDLAAVAAGEGHTLAYTKLMGLDGDLGVGSC